MNALNTLRAQARDRTSSPTILAQLATHADLTVRFFVAMNPRTSRATLESMATDKDRLVPSVVAANPNASRLARAIVRNLLPKRERNKEPKHRRPTSRARNPREAWRGAFEG